VPSQG